MSKSSCREAEPAAALASHSGGQERWRPRMPWGKRWASGEDLRSPSHVGCFSGGKETHFLSHTAPRKITCT